MLIDEVTMDSFGQTFIQLINIRHCTKYHVLKQGKARKIVQTSQLTIRELHYAKVYVIEINNI